MMDVHRHVLQILVRREIALARAAAALLELRITALLLRERRLAPA